MREMSDNDILCDPERCSRNLSQKVFSGEKLCDKETVQLLQYLESSTYGTEEKMQYNFLTDKLDGKDTKKAKSKYLFNRLFLTDERLQESYPFFYKHKFLLPLLYVFRFFKEIFTHPKCLAYEIKNVIKYKSSKNGYNEMK